MVSLQQLGISGKQAPFLEVAEIAIDTRTARFQISLLGFGNRHKLHRSIQAALLHHISMNREESG